MDFILRACVEPKTEGDPVPDKAEVGGVLYDTIANAIDSDPQIGWRVDTLTINEA